MTRNIFVGAAFSAALAVSVAAQGTPQPAQQSSRSQSQRNQQVTVVGCLQTADIPGATAGTSGSSASGAQSTSSKGAEFLLKNARITSSGSAQTTSGTSGTGAAGAAGTTSTGNEFLLTGGNKQDLQKYLNSDVEIHGTLQPRSGVDRSAKGTGTGTEAGSAAGQARSEMHANAQMLRVTSVKQTSPTCTGGN